MNILSIKGAALGIALTATVCAASAQKKFTEGAFTYTVSAGGTSMDNTVIFKGDSSASTTQRGPATIKTIGTRTGDYLAVLVDVPVASIKKAGIATPGELEEGKDKEPSFTFTPTADTKKIGDLNCKKYIAKDTKSGSSYDLWTTTDITAPANILTRQVSGVTGVPVEFTAILMGNAASMVLKSTSDAKVPAGSFTVGKDYDKITLTELAAMAGGRH
jgi:hypothetical protein